MHPVGRSWYAKSRFILSLDCTSLLIQDAQEDEAKEFGGVLLNEKGIYSTVR